MYIHLRNTTWEPVSPILIGHEYDHQTLDIVMRDGSTRDYSALGFLTLIQAKWIGDRYVKVTALGYCKDRQLNGYVAIDEGWHILGRLINDHWVCIVIEDRKPVTFFAPVNQSAQ